MWNDMKEFAEELMWHGFSRSESALLAAGWYCVCTAAGFYAGVWLFGW